MDLSELRRRLSVAHDAWRTQLWPLPAFGVGLAVVVGVLLPRLDARVDANLPASATAYLFGGGPGAARTVLDAIASSLITVTSLTFSLTVVTLQLASSQFSPRLLRTFTRDRLVHATLALFLGTFTYALTVLRVVRAAGDGGRPFVPQLSVTVGFVLAVASVLGLVFFLAHLAREIRVETMLRNVHADASETARQVLSKRDLQDTAAPPAPPVDALPLLAAASGFLVTVDEEEMLGAAIGADAIVFLDRLPGSALVGGTPVGAAWRRAGGALDADAGAQLRKQVGDAISTGFERTAAQDVGFGLRQLTDVATKALSPGINDPTTAVHALGHSAALLCELAGLDLGPRLLRDEDGLIRVVLRRPDLTTLLDLAVAQPRRYGAADPAVLGRLFSLLAELGWSVHEAVERRAVADQLERLRVTVADAGFDATENAGLADLGGQVEAALAGRWAPTAR